jgi:hypothetical protein
VAENDAFKGDELYRSLRSALEFDQFFQFWGFDSGVVEIETGGRKEIESMRFRIEEPLTGSVELFENVLNEAELRMDVGNGSGELLPGIDRAVILPTAFEG